MQEDSRKKNAPRDASTASAIVIGATGVVGKGIVRELLRAQWRVVAVARNTSRLSALQQEHPSIECVAGSVGSDTEATELAGRIASMGLRPAAVVACINLPFSSMRLLDTGAEEFLETLHGNLVTHHCSAKAFLPLLASGGRYVGIGGGMADFTFPGMGAVSVCQAAQRNMYRFFALETEADDLSVLELILVSMIVDPENDAEADPKHIRADEVGSHVRAVLEHPDRFPGPILTLKSRKQIGQPEN